MDLLDIAIEQGQRIDAQQSDVHGLELALPDDFRRHGLAGDFHAWIAV